MFPHLAGPESREESMAGRIFVVSDVVCPWCLVGKRRLERALAETGRTDLALHWLPFELNPDMPPDGMPRANYRARKFGAARAAELDARMEAIGRDEGIAFAFDRVTRTPNTRRAHMLIAHAGRFGRADGIVERLFRAYFEEARDIGDADVLLEVARAEGLDEAEVQAALDSDELRAEVASLEGRAGEMGISGVPFFIPEGGQPVSGAQGTETWVATLRTLPRLAAAASG